MTKTIEAILRAPDGGHWVGDGFPVRSLFSYHGDTKAIIDSNSYVIGGGTAFLVRQFAILLHNYAPKACKS